MESVKMLQAEYLLRKLIVSNGEKFANSHPWLWENDRLKELVFAILTQLVNLDHDHLRQTTNQLYGMGLLDIKVLAGAGPENGSERSMHMEHIVEILSENDFSEEEANKAVVTICEIASGLQKNHNGKIQKYLRSYGEILLNDLPRNFSFSVLNKKETRTAFVYWLQNVANIPIPLDVDVINEFARYHGLDGDELTKAADNMGINLAFLDDLVYGQQLKATEVLAENQITKSN